MQRNLHRLNLILASLSASRAQLLRNAGYLFEQIKPAYQDPAQPDALPGHAAATLAMELAREKALSCIMASQGNDLCQALLLGADTICISPQAGAGAGAGGQLVGQPSCPDHARQMIGQWLNQTHQVVTGIALMSPDGSVNITEADCAQVTLGDLTHDQIEQYIQTGLWQGKAGGYNLADRLQANWPITVMGDPTTVVGLPMQLLGRLLGSMGISPTNLP